MAAPPPPPGRPGITPIHPSRARPGLPERAHLVPPGGPPAEVGQAHFARHGLRGSAWSAGPGARFPAHRHELTKHLFVLRGAITFNGVAFSAGDGLVIAAGFEHEAEAGAAGVECVEAFQDGD